jgi:hypothetical protein
MKNTIQKEETKMARRRIISTKSVQERKHYLTREDKRILLANPELLEALKTDHLKYKSRKWNEKINEGPAPSGLKFVAILEGGIIKNVRAEA